FNHLHCQIRSTHLALTSQVWRARVAYRRMMLIRTRPKERRTMRISRPGINRILVSLSVGLMAIGLTAEAQNFGPWGPAVSVEPARLNQVNNSFNDGCPIKSPDGGMLFSAADRSGNLDIWVSERAKESDPWGSPVALPAGVN